MDEPYHFPSAMSLRRELREQSHALLQLSNELTPANVADAVARMRTVALSLDYVAREVGVLEKSRGNPSLTATPTNAQTEQVLD